MKLPIINLSAYQNLTRNLSRSLETYSRLSIRPLDFSGLAKAGQFTALNTDVAQIAKRVGAMSKSLAAIAKPLNSSFGKMFQAWARHRRVDDAGWLPHYTTPFEDIPADADKAAISAFLEAYYRDNWPRIAEQFEEHVDGLPVDEPAKTAFREAIAAHGQGQHRAVTRMLFPEIERVYRAELMEGKLKGLTGLGDLRGAIPELPASLFGPLDDPGVQLVRRLLDHLYRRVESADEVAAIIDDPVPNRHASIHGIIVYASANSSINMLIMAEFLFIVIGAVKRLQIEPSEGADE
jgi:hypothetical protein